MAKKTIQAGTYTVRELLDRAEFDFEKKAAADYNDGNPDFRRVKIGGLGFDDLDDTVVVPVTADELEITLDGKAETKLTVELDDEQKGLRAYSLLTAAEADSPPLSEVPERFRPVERTDD